MSRRPRRPGLGTWERRLEGLEQRFADVGMRLPNDLLAEGATFRRAGPGGRVIPDAGAPVDARRRHGEVVLLLLAAW